MQSSEEATIAQKNVFWVCALERMVRFAVALLLLLCILIGFVVAVPLWLAERVLKMLGFSRNY